MLLIYKFISYTVEFIPFKNGTIKHNRNNTFNKEAEKYGFQNLLNIYMKEKDGQKLERAYRQIEVKEIEGVLFAPQILRRDIKDSSVMQEKQRDFFSKINQYYENNERITSIISICLSEIIMNFLEHATEENLTIIAAYCTKNNIEIACADNGEGIIKTLKQNLKTKQLKTLQEKDIFAKCIEKGFSSKEKSFHMGYGLWLISEIVKNNNGEFCIISDNFYLKHTNSVEINKCDYWKGTIVYLYMNLENVNALCDIFNCSDNIITSHINWR